MMRLHQLLYQLMQNPEFVRAWRDLEPNAQLAADILGYRIRNGLTLTKLSERSGVSRTILARLESNVGNPRLDTLKRIAKALGCELRVHLLDAHDLQEMMSMGNKPSECDETSEDLLKFRRSVTGGDDEEAD